ncbi:CDP-glycerol glycerophosphotransferase family protein [Vibrio paucivorans]
MMKHYNITYPLLKFFFAKLLIPIIQVFAWVSTPLRKSRQQPVALLVSSRTNSVSSSYSSLIPELERRSVKIEFHSVNYSNLALLDKIKKIYLFFCQYRNTDLVFLDDTFLPISFSFKIRKFSPAYIVQIWHSCGLFKQTGLDVCKTNLSYYLGKANYKNYDLVSVSAESCRRTIAGFMGVDHNQVKALGLSRTDDYFNTQRCDEISVRFFKEYPNAKSSKVIAYAPTYRGEAFNVDPSPIPSVIDLFSSLEGEYTPFIAPHPHEVVSDNKFELAMDISSILHLVDILITDYSSLAMDYMVANPRGRLILYVPDYEKYSEDVGFYVDIQDITDEIAYNHKQLEALIRASTSVQGFSSYKGKYLSCCDGASTVRLLDYLNL